MNVRLLMVDVNTIATTLMVVSAVPVMLGTDLMVMAPLALVSFE